MHFCECLPAPALCLINYWTLKNLWEARALCDWARRHEKTLSSWVSNGQNRGLIRQYKHRVNDGSAMKYLHPESMLRWEGEWVGFYHLGLNGMPCRLHHSVILKAKQKEKKRNRKDRKKRKKKRKKRKKSYWFGDVLLFAIVFYKSKASFADSSLTKSKFLLILKETQSHGFFFLIF